MADTSDVKPPAVDSGRWQCSGCRRTFLAPWQAKCPGCGRIDYWTGSVPPFETVKTEGWSASGTLPDGLAWTAIWKPGTETDDPAFWVRSARANVHIFYSRMHRQWLCVGLDAPDESREWAQPSATESDVRPWRWLEANLAANLASRVEEDAAHALLGPLLNYHHDPRQVLALCRKVHAHDPETLGKLGLPLPKSGPKSARMMSILAREASLARREASQAEREADLARREAAVAERESAIAERASRGEVAHG